MTARKTRTVLIVHTDGMGNADEYLRRKLIGTYFSLLNENDMLPMAICFYTEGVKLAVEGSPVIDILKSLEAKGVAIILCKTCLNYYDLEDKVAVGVIGGMTDILEAQWRAEKVITL